MRSALAACMVAMVLSQGAAVAQTPPAEPAGPERDCFRTNQIRGWGVIDEDTIRVRINSSRQYALHLATSARRARYADAITVNSGSGWICTGREVGVELYIDDAMARTWVVEHVERLPPPTNETSARQ